jgi:hypothetical protein
VHRSLGIVLICPWISEIGEHSVAHIPGDETTVLDDYLPGLFSALYLRG